MWIYNFFRPGWDIESGCDEVWEEPVGQDSITAPQEELKAVQSEMVSWWKNIFNFDILFVITQNKENER